MAHFSKPKLILAVAMLCYILPCSASYHQGGGNQQDRDTRRARSSPSRTPSGRNRNYSPHRGTNTGRHSSTHADAAGSRSGRTFRQPAENTGDGRSSGRSRHHTRAENMSDPTEIENYGDNFYPNQWADVPNTVTRSSRATAKERSNGRQHRPHTGDQRSGTYSGSHKRSLSGPKKIPPSYFDNDVKNSHTLPEDTETRSSTVQRKQDTGKKHKCPTCGQEFTQKDDFDCHKETKHMYQCYLCGSSKKRGKENRYANKEHLINHVIKKHVPGKVKFRCASCERGHQNGFETISALDIHVKTRHTRRLASPQHDNPVLLKLLEQTQDEDPPVDD